jgi:nitrite reductase/ring-hydroxylating ferredoxin subunit/uncharacterized membrane protein
MMGASDVVAQQTWLDPVSDVLQKAVENAYAAGGPAGQQVKNFLSGTWLGHPLHPAVTDLPVGSWTASLMLDMLEASSGRRDLAVAADAALSIGLAGSLLAALSGLSDWHFTIDRPRRLGVAHGLLNTGAAGLYGASLVMRLSGARAWGRRTAMLAYGMALFSAWLGGELVFDEQIGVDHAAKEAPSDFVPALDETELQEGKPRRVDVNGILVMLVRQGGRIYALGETCAHLGGPLSEGEISDGIVTCPWHGSQFRLSDGQIVNGPAAFPQPCYQTRVRNGKIEVGPFCKQVPEESPASLRQGLRAAGEAISGATS